nr:DUF58 domain-containing protein [Saccharibacter sp. 17.LH.SD]
MAQGQHGSQRAGQGEDFWQFRPHLPQEPASSIDWKQSARSPNPDTLWVRERERHTPHTLILWVDPSASMQWRSSPDLPIKKDEALMAALTLGKAALNGGEYVGVLGSKRCYYGAQNLSRLAHDLTHQQNNIPDLRTTSPRAQLLIISDFLWPEQEIKNFLNQCRHRPGKTFLLCILDPEERDLAYSGHLTFSSLENETPVTLPAVESLQTHYQQTMDHHLRQFTEAPLQHIMPFSLHMTNHSIKPVLFDLHQKLGGKR